MYKLHYNVDAGKKVNVVYKGMDIEVQAGEGENVNVEENKEVDLDNIGVYEITPSEGYDAMSKVTINAWMQELIGDNVFYSTCDRPVINANRKGIYTFVSVADIDLVYKDGAQAWETGELIILPFDDWLIVNVNVPVFEYEHPFYYMELPFAYLKGGDQSTHPIQEFIVRRGAEVQGNLTIGTNSDQHARYRIYFQLILNADIILNGCDLYIYTNDIFDGCGILDGTHGGTVHVPSNYPHDTVGTHAVIKDLPVPEETN